MTERAKAWCLSPRSWRPLPCGGRALLREHYAPHYSHVPERPSKRSQKRLGASVADVEANVRAKGPPKLSPSERRRYGAGKGRAA